MYNDYHDPGNLTENPVQDSEGATPTNSELPSAGTSSHDRQHKMSKAMVEWVFQYNFYGDSKIYYMALQSFSKGQTKADLFHDDSLVLQECMREPVAFHAEMMDYIMYFNQAIKQPFA